MAFSAASAVRAGAAGRTLLAGRQAARSADAGFGRAAAVGSLWANVGNRLFCSSAILCGPSGSGGSLSPQARSVARALALSRSGGSAAASVRLMASAAANQRDRDLGSAVLDAAQGVSRPSAADMQNNGDQEEGFNPQYLSLEGESLPAPEMVAEVEAEMATENPDFTRVARLLVQSTQLFAVVRLTGAPDPNTGSGGYELLMSRAASEADDGALTLNLFSSQEAAQTHLDLQAAADEASQIAVMDGISIFGQYAAPDGGDLSSTLAKVKVDDKLNISNNDGYLEKLGAAILLERLAGEVSAAKNMDSFLKKGKMDMRNAKMLRAMRRFQPYFLVLQRDPTVEEESWSLCSTEDQHEDHYVFAFTFIDHANNFVKNLVDQEADSAQLRAVSGAQLFGMLKGLEADGIILNPGNPDRTMKFQDEIFQRGEAFLAEKEGAEQE